MLKKLITLVAKTGKEQDVLDLIKSMIDPSLAEDGCVLYTAYSESDSPGTIYLIEGWETAEAVENHKNSSHFLKFKAVASEFLADKSSVSIKEL